MWENKMSSKYCFTSFIHSLLLHFSPEDFIDTESPVPPDPEQPDCTKILELPYSIHAFQHLRVSGELSSLWGDIFFFYLVLIFIKSIFLLTSCFIILPMSLIS